MKYLKPVIIVSLLLNVVLLFSFVRRKVYFSAHPQVDWAEYHNKQKVEEYKNFNIDTSDIVFVGTSLTEDFPFEDLLSGYRIKNRGISGNTTSHVLHRIEDIARKRPRKLFIEMGTNDLKEGAKEDSAFMNYTKTLQILSKYKVPTFVQSVLPTRGEYSYRNATIVRLNERIKEYAAANGFVYIDTYSKMCINGQMDSSLTYDGLHLTAKGYKLWRQQIENFVK